MDKNLDRSPLSLPFGLLDRIRIHILQLTLKVPPFKSIFLLRAYRLSAFFLFSVLFNLTMSLYFPLWALLFGPLILGIPHLLSTIRYVPKFSLLGIIKNKRHLYSGVSFLFVMLSILRIWLWENPRFLPESLPNLPEVIFAILLAMITALIAKPGISKILFGFFLFLALGFFSFMFPFETLGAIVLIHNGVGFVYWMIRAPSKGDRLSASIAFAIFLCLSGIILMGGFDGIILPRTIEILNGSMDDLSIGQLIFPDGSRELWSRAVSAYAFGQGLHYFVWLKAIPEQELPHEYPVSFSVSSSLLSHDVGNKIIWGILILTLFFILAGVFWTYPQARIWYLAVAAFHGYFEFAGLIFIRKPELI